VQRHGISRQLQRAASGSTPRDRATILQIYSSCSSPIDRPRQNAFRYPPAVANCPTTCAGRRHTPLSYPLLHRRTACWTSSIPIIQLTRGAQIPIAPRHDLRSLKRGFLPWRLSDAGRRTRGTGSQAAGIRNPAQQRTFNYKSGWSGLCHGTNPLTRERAAREAEFVAATEVPVEIG
jgi:hypothetical protein